ncbi:MAG: putative peptidase M15 [Prokaryotic dsDNA virus sp.]|nr:MAG: putative peptidase M15 [Prokaryotic dsDNA virus sp.]|tara:strand:+ start:4560 stop:4931 length:372 start_codon:yes stop_codon:yes gene_type:complete
MKYKYFDLKEFASPDEPGSGKHMRHEFLEMLDSAREEAGVPFKITSGFRTEAYNKDLLKRGYKASKNSSHLKGCAADIACSSSDKRLKIVQALIKIGFTRLGIAKSFIHVDNDPVKPDAIWLY